MTVKAFDGKRMGRYKNHLYRITEVNVDKQVFQNFTKREEKF